MWFTREGINYKLYLKELKHDYWGLKSDGSAAINCT